MLKKLLLTLTMILALASLCAFGQIKPASEEERTLLHKEEIIDCMIQAGRMSPDEQKDKVDRLWANDGGSQTPRSDFLYCYGFAYLDHYKAQACLGRAFENGIGIVQNYTDAYVWYTIALDHPVEDEAVWEKIETAKERVKMTLFSVYPAPSDFELDELVKKQKENIAQYQEEIED